MHKKYRNTRRIVSDLKKALGGCRYDLAAALDITPSAVGNYTAGIRRPTVDIATRIVALAKEYGIEAKLEDFYK